MKRIFISFLIFFIGSQFIQTKAISYSSNPEGFISEVIEEAKVILSSSFPLIHMFYNWKS